MINLYNKNRERIIAFYDFVKEEDSTLDVVYFKAIISFRFFNFEIKTEAELFDFKCLHRSLQSIYQNKFTLKHCEFTPMDGSVLLFFDENLGQINVKCDIQSFSGDFDFEFNFQMDQSFLPELIEEIGNVLEKIK